ncbi:MazG nucleotide pyrophosphohydrolase domain-containing protein [Brachybacterium sp. GPGPB12]|uniref:MazG nucleotide pyrophosphohydrolase domain-containing protein n=1 Tax=Brachybacterium sp. GPGPB12 TaxID=3023517 RepID=UPI0031342DCD
MEAARAPSGDAWTHRQTHASLARYLLEEAYEVLEVIDDPAGHGPGAPPDELGDLLFQILFHARVGQEEEPAWDVDDVARSFVAKMERRNPHVFGDAPEQALEDPADVEQIIAQWHAVKAQEKRAGAKRAGRSRAAPGRLRRAPSAGPRGSPPSRPPCRPRRRSSTAPGRRAGSSGCSRRPTPRPRPRTPTTGAATSAGRRSTWSWPPRAATTIPRPRARPAREDLPRARAGRRRLTGALVRRRPPPAATAGTGARGGRRSA